MRRCLEPNPEIPESPCFLPEGQHLDHMDRQSRTWPNAMAREAHARRPTVRKAAGGRGRNRAGDASAEAKRRIAEIAGSVTPEQRVNALADGRRPSKEESRDLVEASLTSSDDRTAFYLVMAELATQRELLSTNDVWDEIRRRETEGFRGNRNYVGVVGRMGIKIGLWEPMPGKVLNTSGNGHSEDDGVVRYASKVVGSDFASLAPRVIEQSRTVRASRI